ncbi:hypothetical protein EUGRSUZ_L01603 [Eucalyptus grandis]|uniref:peroxidase n=3 Tax=Eucalyptus grandis TaxID=71139 RepID=A0AAD9WIM8_EUCGR|nr:hypothetical protein EUGRSUZ_L01603 [Eucalyptus grandis]
MSRLNQELIFFRRIISLFHMVAQGKKSMLTCIIVEGEFCVGCDGSVLLDSTANNKAEKVAVPNQSLTGFDVIDEIKEKLEETCPGVVSCADILALAARDSVSFQFKKSMWEVLTGRRDGRISRESEALSNIPSPFFNFTTLKQSFANKSLTLHDLVVLSGGHTIGAQCKTLSDNATTVAMDPGSPLSFDSHYYKAVNRKQGLFQSDAALLTNLESRKIVNELLDQDGFFTEFGQSMKRMGAVEVLTGSNGEIRKKCNVIN